MGPLLEPTQALLWPSALGAPPIVELLEPLLGRWRAVRVAKAGGPPHSFLGGGGEGQPRLRRVYLLWFFVFLARNQFFFFHICLEFISTFPHLGPNFLVNFC